MNHDEELRLLEHLGKGKAAKKAFFASQQFSKTKYASYQKSAAKSNVPAPSLKEMLRTASRQTQAIFKISSYGKGEKKVLAHMRYISRCGKLELEDQDGNKLENLTAHRSFLKAWAVDFGDNSRSRDTMHLVLSTPPGTNRNDAQSAAKAFLEKEYKAAGHDYVFVAHQDTDHPHVHAVIKMTSHLGKKLNPRKAYLRQVRKEYAEICRTYGIEVEASSRAERGLSGPSQKTEFVQMKRRNCQPKADIALIDKVKKERLAQEIFHHPAEQKMLKRNQIIRKRYAEKARLVAKKAEGLASEQEKLRYKNAAKLLETYAKSLPMEASRGEKLHGHFDAKNGISANREASYELGNIEQKTLNQYYAVTVGVADENGIYHSPGEVVKDKLKASLQEHRAASAKKAKDKGLGLELELELEIEN